MSNTAQEIRSRILQAKPTQVRQQATPQPSRATGGTSMITALLGLLILVLSVATVGTLMFKKRPQAQPVVVADRGTPEKAQPPVVMENPAYAKAADVNQRFAELEKKMAAQDQKMAVWTHRVWLLGVAHNENVNISTVTSQQRGYGDPGYIYFDSDWKLSRMPKTMQMDEKQRQDLEKSVK